MQRTIDNRKNLILCLGTDYGWEMVFEKPEQYQLRFSRAGILIDVWYSKMTVGVLSKQGGDRYYKRVGDQQLEKLFDNPIPHVMSTSPSQLAREQEMHILDSVVVELQAIIGSIKRHEPPRVIATRIRTLLYQIEQKRHGHTR